MTTQTPDISHKSGFKPILRKIINMKSIKETRTKVLMVLGLSFGLMVSTVASGYVEETRALAEKGDVKSQETMGLLYKNGIDVDKNYHEAFKWFERAANQGDISSQIVMGYMYGEGQGVRQNDKKAFEWTQKAANKGDAFAQIRLGLFYEYGIGVRLDKTQAKEWYGKSCDNGDQNGCDYYRKLNRK